jgi:hypothetical protein
MRKNFLPLLKTGSVFAGFPVFGCKNLSFFYIPGGFKKMMVPPL